LSRPVRERLSQLNLNRRGIRREFYDLTIDDFKDYGSEDLEAVREFIRDYIDNIDSSFDENKGLFLFGSNGVGKSFLASLIVKEAYRHRYTSKRVTFSEYISEYTRVWDAKSVEEREEIESEFYNDYKAVEFLALEEVGKEIDSKISAPILEDLLRYREDKGLVTIMCSNLEPKVLVEKYGSSIASLIKGNMTPIKIVGSDKRQEYYDERVCE